MCEICDESKPFRGIQIVLVGEFKQLRPVPNKFDSGEFVFMSDVFKETLAHKFTLFKPMRHDPSEIWSSFVF